MGRKETGEEPGLVVVWEFRVRSSKRQVFEKAYGSDGVWAKLFGQAPGYLGTKLVRDLNRRDRYLTMDFWQSHRAHQLFKKKHSAMYRRLDEKCKPLTVSEVEVGQFIAGC